MSDEIHADPHLLRMCLLATVPLWMDIYASWSEHALRIERERLGDAIVANAAVLVKQPTAKVGKDEGSAAGFNNVAKGLAIAALQPCGVTLLGLHWCAGRQHYGVPGIDLCDAPGVRRSQYAECAYPKCFTPVDRDRCGWLPGFEGKRFACATHSAEVGEAA